MWRSPPVSAALWFTTRVHLAGPRRDQGRDVGEAVGPVARHGVDRLDPRAVGAVARAPDAARADLDRSPCCRGSAMSATVRRSVTSTPPGAAIGPVGAAAPDASPVSIAVQARAVRRPPCRSSPSNTSPFACRERRCRGSRAAPPSSRCRDQRASAAQHASPDPSPTIHVVVPCASDSPYRADPEQVHYLEGGIGSTATFP